MLDTLRAVVIHRVFGRGISGEVAERSISWLDTETRKAIAKEPEQIATVRLKPGESYTVIARPKATRAERKMAKRLAGLTDTEHKLSKPTRRQLRAARKLSMTQRKLDNARPGSRKWRKVADKERERGNRFDGLLTPSERLARVRAERERVDAELTESREANWWKARGDRELERREDRVTVYD